MNSTRAFSTWLGNRGGFELRAGRRGGVIKMTAGWTASAWCVQSHLLLYYFFFFTAAAPTNLTVIWNVSVTKRTTFHKPLHGWPLKQSEVTFPGSFREWQSKMNQWICMCCLKFRSNFLCKIKQNKQKKIFSSKTTFEMAGINSVQKIKATSKLFNKSELQKQISYKIELNKRNDKINK